MYVLIHSSKTMRDPQEPLKHVRQPRLINDAQELHTYLKTLSYAELAQCMHISENITHKTQKQIKQWNPHSSVQLAAIDSFIGDIYSGLQVHTFDAKDRDYADRTIRILSGLYGILKPLDAIQPYRLEMGYRLPDQKYKSLYRFWDQKIADTLGKTEPIVNTSADEYTKAIMPHIDSSRVITPRFLTISSKTGTPTFVVVHTKIARGAFAHWIVKNRISDITKLTEFNELGYKYRKDLSTKTEPAFICETFGGIGLSVRLK